MTRTGLLTAVAMAAAVLATGHARAQDLTTPVVPPPPAADVAPAEDQVRFSAGQLQYDIDADVVTASGDVRMYRDSERLRADTVVWNRKTGRVTASGNIAVTNPQGDVAYGDEIELTDSLKDGVVQNMLVVLDRGGRIAADKGVRDADGVVSLLRAAYTPCSVTNSAGCPKDPSWKVTAVRVTYRPERERIYFRGSRFHLFGLPAVPLPDFSAPVGDGSDSGLLNPILRIDGVNGLEVATPYYFNLAPNRGLTVTPHVYTSVLPMLQGEFRALTELGAVRLTGYATASRRSTTLTTTSTDTEQAFRGYLDGVANFQFDPHWDFSGSLRLVTDPTFLKRYQISDDDVLRTTGRLERVDRNSYFSVAGWAVQTLRIGDSQGMQPVALPEIDYRRHMPDVAGGVLALQLNSLALGRAAGEDTQRAFASAQWDLRRVTRWGQEVTLTAFARGDVYNASDVLQTAIASYRGDPGFQGRAIGEVAVDIRWPFIGPAFGGTQRITPRFQIVASPRLKNLSIPNEDSRAVDLEDSNLFALNRFPGYDRYEDSTRFTYGLEYALDLADLRFDAIVGQSYRLSQRPSIFPDGTGLTDRFSDIVGRNELRYRDFISIVHRYRLDKDGLAVRRNEVDATVGSRRTYASIGYLLLNRNITPALEDLRDHEELRAAGRVAFGRFWAAYGSTIIDLTDRREDPLSIANGFDPVRTRVGVQYEDDCLILGIAYKRNYQTTGDARQSSSVLFTISLKNLGR